MKQIFEKEQVIIEQDMKNVVIKDIEAKDYIKLLVYEPNEAEIFLLVGVHKHKVENDEIEEIPEHED
jgi:hypothetical protein